MTRSLGNRGSIKVAVGLATLALLGGCALLAGSGRPSGYVVDSRNTVVKDPFNLCWRTGYWTPAIAIAECDSDLVRAAPAPKPAAVPGPAPAKPVPPVAAVVPPVLPAPAVSPPAATAPPAIAKPAAVKRCDATVTLEADQLFAFGSAALTPAARARLDGDVLGRIRACKTLESIVVTGHTDRIGSVAANQRLSEQRAAVVRDHLAARGVERGRIEVIGMGKTQPVRFCPDQRDQRALAACLAPNRRVTIETRGRAE